MTHVAVEAIGVSKSFATREALHNVDLIVRRGEVHGLLGPNGAGKTTLLRVLLGLVRKDAGSVRLLGRDMASMGDRLPDGVAGQIDTPAFYRYMTGRQNLALLAQLDGLKRTARRLAIDDALEQTGLGVRADVAVRAYSAGMRQRLAIASALLRSPRLLLLDEPTSSLDPSGARDVRGLARRIAKHGAAVLLSSHDMAEVEELCSSLTVIDRGHVVFSGTIDELRRRAPAASHALQTSDDRASLALGARMPGVRVMPSVGGGLQVWADIDALDAYVIALGRAAIAVRSLERRARSLESFFFDLTTHAHPDVNEVTRAS